MFGTSSFAQTPFAALAGTSYALSITENFAAADFSTQLSAFSLVGIFTAPEVVL
jgi:hypothetical protein